MNLCKQQLIGEMKRAQKIGRKGGGLYMWVACVDCGKERWTLLKRWSPVPKCCSSCFARKLGKGQTGSNHPQWNGGRGKRSDGYINVLITPDDFFYPMAGIRGYALEHRIVMAKHLGRCLHKWEIVHHRNGKQDDNRLANLELLPHGRFHVVDLATKSHIKRLEKRVKELEEELALVGGANG